MGTVDTQCFEFISRGDESPKDSDYCLILGEDAMEPFFRCGDMVYITRSILPEEFQPGVFMYEGKVICRQWCEDYSGTLHLLCPERKNAALNITIPRSERGKCLCLGSVITRRPLPPPDYCT
ncbi:MAG: hypothetical protein Q4E35_03470 [Eubacteriales bacterium]|nr:hypothetical protein [Eubacteriales bacterium]